MKTLADINLQSLQFLLSSMPADMCLQFNDAVPHLAVSRSGKPTTDYSLYCSSPGVCTQLNKLLPAK